MASLAPHDTDDFFNGHGQPECHEKAEKRVLAIDSPHHRPFHGQADEPHENRGKDQGRPIAYHFLQRKCEVGAQGEQGAMAEVDHLHDAQNQHETQGHDPEQQSLHQAVEQLCVKLFHDRSAGSRVSGRKALASFEARAPPLVY